MTPTEIAAAFEAFDAAAEAVAGIRVPVRRGRPSAEEVRRHAARAAAHFYLSTTEKRTARAGLPDDAPEPPARVRGPARHHQGEDERG